MQLRLQTGQLLITSLLGFSRVGTTFAKNQGLGQSINQKVLGAELLGTRNFAGQAGFEVGGNMTRGAVISLFHGGGPMPLLNDPSHKDIISSFKTRVPEILRLKNADVTLRPRAIVLVTAHWSAAVPTVSTGSKHDLYYDYGGFPPEAYELTYDAPGSPEVAEDVLRVFKEEGLLGKGDERRGWDHGVFVPMLMIAPEARIPIVQVSVLKNEDAASHFRMGVALSKLRDSNIAIVCSGAASMHNFRLMFSDAASNSGFQARSAEWSKTLTAAVTEKDVGKRGELLTKWRDFPGSYTMHPKGGAEHFLPLIVAAGAGGESEEAKWYTDEFRGFEMFSYYWN